MLTKILNFIFKKIESIDRNNQLFIVPTFDGFKLATLNFILLIVGLVYANNYVLFFDFVLFCLFLGSMYYTHFNLQGLKLISVKPLYLHANENGLLNLTFQTNSNFGHNYIEIELINSNLIKELSSSSFTLNPKINNKKSLHVSLPVSALMRGHSNQLKFRIETFFPFHLFRCFRYFKIEFDISIFPEINSIKLFHEKTKF